MSSEPLLGTSESCLTQFCSKAGRAVFVVGFLNIRQVQPKGDMRRSLESHAMSDDTKIGKRSTGDSGPARHYTLLVS